MKLNYKNKVLFLGVALLLLSSYYLAIDKTLVLRQESQFLSNEVLRFTEVPRKLSDLQHRVMYYDSILTTMDLGNTSLQNNLLKSINREAEKNNTQVMDFNPPHSAVLSDHQLETYSFELKGAYTDILKVVHSIEQKGNFGEIIHIDFQKKKDYRTDTHSLNATVFVQSVK